MKSHFYSAVLLLWFQITLSEEVDAPWKEGCITTSHTKVPQKFLRNYTTQHKPLYPVDAVRFITNKGITICSSPSSPWAIRAMKFLDAKKTQSVKTSAHRLVTAASVEKDNHKYDSVINIYF